MTNDHGRALRHLGFGAAAALLAAGLAVAAPAAAQDEPADGQGKKVERVIVVSHASKGDEARPHRFRIVDLDGDHAGCDKTEVAGADGREKTKVIVCGQDDAGSAERAARLEKALARIQNDESLSAEQRERVATAMREAIGRLRETR